MNRWTVLLPNTLYLYWYLKGAFKSIFIYQFKCCFSFLYFEFFPATESLPSEMNTLALTPASMVSSLPSTPSFKSHLQMTTGMAPPANSEPLDPTFLLVWPHPQGITQIKGTRFFPTSVLPVVLFRDLQSGKGVIDDGKMERTPLGQSLKAVLLKTSVDQLLK